MTQTELVAQQALELAMLKDQLRDCQKDMLEISMTLCCIGGALNDNMLGYSADQLRPLARINAIAETWR